MQWIPFLLYVVVTSFTPGPNNIMSMAFASRTGYKNTLRFILGVAAGTFVIALLASFFNLLLYSFLPTVKVWMGILGGVYLLYLAMKMLLHKPGSNPTHPDKLNSFFSGFLLQFINPKVILYAITAVSTFIIPYYQSNGSLLLFSLFLGFIGYLSTSSWAFFGAVFQQFLAKYDRAFSIVMGLLLIYSAIVIFVDQ
ncbi:LysE family translocator [Brevibacillus nitrificans]|uniref:LysE family translocator n=1 Tax=Brevibacillus nitrificans TaxID=651560 RepID=UPI00262F500B|nr:LysE family transporter [Brevibacillus nitrificans]MED1796679.1 LysE family transporter [Brevibacillus nitrificans]